MILGISISHNSTACLVNNGKIIYCCSEERFTRIKNEWGFPSLAIDYILRNIVSPSKIRQVSVGENCISDFGLDKFADIVYLGDYRTKDNFIKNKIKVVLLVSLNFLLKKIKKKKIISI